MPTKTELKYRYKHSYDSPIEEVSFTHPFLLPSEQSALWEHTDGYLRESSKNLRGTVRFSWVEKSFLLMQGTLHTINFVLTAAQEGSPLKTLVFLDKSGRLAGYMFSTLWNILAQTHDLNSVTPKPQLRFFNVGMTDFDKHYSNHDLALCAQIFNPEDLWGDGVAVIDEYISTGETVKRAAKTLFELYYTNARILAAYTHLPYWYGDDTVKTVEEPDVSKTTLTALRALDVSAFEALRTVVEVVDYDSIILNHLFVSLYQAKTLQAFLDLTQRYHDLLTPSMLFDFYDLPLKQIIISNQVPSVIAYFKSAGTFLTMKTTSPEIQVSSFYYRQLLKMMIQLTAPHVELKHFQELKRLPTISRRSLRSRLLGA